MMAQVVKKGYTIEYDDAVAVITAGGRDVANFASIEDGPTALVQALRWIKSHRHAPLETDKGVFDPGVRDEFGNLVKVADAPPTPSVPPVTPPVDDSTELDNPGPAESEANQ
jgi:hypothetical protein